MTGKESDGKARDFQQMGSSGVPFLQSAEQAIVKGWRVRLCSPAGKGLVREKEKAAPGSNPQSRFGMQLLEGRRRWRGEGSWVGNRIVGTEGRVFLAARWHAGKRQEQHCRHGSVQTLQQKERPWHCGC